MNEPNEEYTLSGKYAWNNISTIVTNVAIIIMYTGILTSLGTIFLIKEIIIFE